MPVFWSHDLRVAFRPFGTYDDLTREAIPGTWTLVRGPLRWLLFTGAFVSLVTAGRLVWYHLVFAACAWMFSPLLQLLWVGLWARWTTPERPWSVAVDLHFRGQGPWYLFFLLFAATCLWANAPGPLAVSLLRSSTGVLLLIAWSGWSMLLTYACFRSGLRTTRLRAWTGTAGYYLCYAASLLGYFLVTDQLIPLWMNPP